MSEETLNILNELSKKETTDLALNIMELTADNMVKDKEIEKLNNIINELEEDIEDALKEARVNNYHMGEWDNNNRGRYDAYLYVYDKLQELKGEDKE